MASRAASGALHDWFYETQGGRLTPAWMSSQDAAAKAETADQIRQYVRLSLDAVGRYAGQTSRIFGTMVRDFPSTAAIAVVRDTEEGTELQCFWAGDSRVYLLDQHGLAQLTEDDVDGRNAMSNLRSDGALSNVMSADGDFEIHASQVFRFREKDAYAVFASTDGCFGYLPTPMDFEYMVLESLLGVQTPAGFEQRLEKNIRAAAGDDYTLAWMSFGYGDFQTMQAALKKRMEILRRDYIEPMEQDPSEEMQEKLWTVYRENYERYLTA